MNIRFTHDVFHPTANRKEEKDKDVEFRNRFNILAVHWISYIGKINRDFLANSWTLDTVSGQAFKVNIDLRSFIGREQCINALVPTPFHDPTFSTRQSVFATEDVLFHCLVGVDGEDLLFYGLVGDDGGVEHLLAKLVKHLLPVVVKCSLNLIDRLWGEKIISSKKTI